MRHGGERIEPLLTKGQIDRKFPTRPFLILVHSTNHYVNLGCCGYRSLPYLLSQTQRWSKVKMFFFYREKFSMWPLLKIARQFLKNFKGMCTFILSHLQKWEKRSIDNATALLEKNPKYHLENYYDKTFQEFDIRKMLLLLATITFLQVILCPY